MSGSNEKAPCTHSPPKIYLPSPCTTHCNFCIYTVNIATNLWISNHGVLNERLGANFEITTVITLLYTRDRVEPGRLIIEPLRMAEGGGWNIARRLININHCYQCTCNFKYLFLPSAMKSWVCVFKQGSTLNALPKVNNKIPNLPFLALRKQETTFSLYRKRYVYGACTRYSIVKSQPKHIKMRSGGGELLGFYVLNMSFSLHLAYHSWFMVKYKSFMLPNFKLFWLWRTRTALHFRVSLHVVLGTPHQVVVFHCIPLG